MPKPLAVLSQSLGAHGYEVSSFYKGESVQGANVVAPGILRVIQGHKLHGDWQRATLLSYGVHLVEVESAFLAEKLKAVPEGSWVRTTPHPLRLSVQDDTWIDAKSYADKGIIQRTIDAALAAAERIANTLSTPATIREEVRRRRKHDDPELVMWLSSYGKVFAPH